MHRIDDEFATPERLFQDGNPLTGLLATAVTAAWLNDVQEGLLKPISTAGLSPQKGVHDLLERAIKWFASQAVKERLWSITDVGGVGDDATNNTGAFNTAETTGPAWWYLPPGIFRTTRTQLSKVYYGPGCIRFSDGYLQSGLPSSVERPRSAMGPLTLTSPNDINLVPVGDIQVSSRRIINLAKGVFPRDAANMQNVSEEISKAFSGAMPGLFPATQDWTPAVIGGITPGDAIYAPGNSRWGRLTRVGHIAFVTGGVEVTEHTGTGQVTITGLPVTIARNGYIGTVLSSKFNPAPTDWTPQTLICYAEMPNVLRIAFDVENFAPGGAQIDADGFGLTFSIFFEVAE